jgi:hypothetical protein
MCYAIDQAAYMLHHYGHGGDAATLVGVMETVYRRLPFQEESRYPPARLLGVARPSADVMRSLASLVPVIGFVVALVAVRALQWWVMRDGPT